MNPGKDEELKAHIRRELERGIEPVALADSTGVPKTTIRHWRRNLETAWINGRIAVREHREGWEESDKRARACKPRIPA